MDETFDLLVRLRRELDEAVVERERALREEIQRLRAEGYSYAHIGKVLGVTRQAAWERFGKGRSK